jgi:hypothetical protein
VELIAILDSAQEDQAAVVEMDQAAVHMVAVAVEEQDITQILPLRGVPLAAQL